VSDKRVLALWAVAALLLVAFWELAGDFASSPAVRSFDVLVSEAIQSFRAPWLTSAMLVITALGSWPVVVGATGLLLFGQWRRGDRGGTGYSAAIVGGCAALTQVAKYFFERTRPPLADALVTLPSSFSFPSGHTSGSLTLAWAAAVALVRSGAAEGLSRPATLAVLALYPVLVGVSRVYLGVHWPSDILASWLLAGAWIAACSAVALMRAVGDR
jgi:undecaprenyl-diphosphatase